MLLGVYSNVGNIFIITDRGAYEFFNWALFENYHPGFPALWTNAMPYIALNWEMLVNTIMLAIDGTFCKNKLIFLYTQTRRIKEPLRSPAPFSPFPGGPSVLLCQNTLIWKTFANIPIQQNLINLWAN